MARPVDFVVSVAEHFPISGDEATFRPGGDISKLPFVHCLDTRDIYHCSPISPGHIMLVPVIRQVHITELGRSDQLE